MKKLLIALATLVMAAGITLGGAAPAQANPGPGLCLNGWVWEACVEANVPNWGWGHGWNPGHGWNDWRHHGKHGKW